MRQNNIRQQALSIAFLLPFLHAFAYGAEPETTKPATETGLVLYSVMNTDQNQIMVREFQKKYPRIVVDGWVGGTEAMLSRVLTEARAGAMKADVIFAGGSEMQVFKKRGLLQKYISPEAKAFPEAYKDPEGHWITVHPLLEVTAYNTQQVKAEEAPKTYEDLLKPQWKGKMSMDRVEYDWFATLQKAWGKERAIDFCRKLATQNIRFDSGHTKISTMVAAGDIPLGINMYAYRVSSLRKTGAPIHWVALDPVVAILEVVGVASPASHPNAARSFVDFMLSIEGQNLIRSFGRVPGRIGVEPQDRELAKIKPYPTDVAAIYERGLDVFGNEYREIFGLR